jgi:osmotically-inducible protein OsmY
VPDGVRASVSEGNVFLAGTVRYSAQRSAAGVAGALSVTNQIEVRGGA